MKHVFWLFFTIILGFSAFLPTTGFAAPSTGAAFDVDLNFAPGSVVRFEHLTIEDGLSQNAGLAICSIRKRVLTEARSGISGRR